MAPRVFALLIGIDRYSSRNIRRLHSCAGDARQMKKWLTDDLHVPQDHISLILDEMATKQHIEDEFMGHLVNNQAIERGDAIIIYFAGYGSRIAAPSGWYEEKSRNVDILCTHDAGAKDWREGRIAGISDRSFIALLRELALVRGDNITVILDCSFTPSRSHFEFWRRGKNRFTEIKKVDPEHLYAGLWRGALGHKHSFAEGFYQQDTAYTVICASPYGVQTREVKTGGDFTTAFLEARHFLPFHQSSYTQLVDHLFNVSHGKINPVSLGRNKHRIMFDGIPFIPDTSFIPAVLDGTHKIRVEMGALHGATEGSELALHPHNLVGSFNPSTAAVRIFQVYPTWSSAHCKGFSQSAPESCWSKITRWNNAKPCQIHVKRDLMSFYRAWKISSLIPKIPSPLSLGGVDVLKVSNQSADISLIFNRKDVIVEMRDEALGLYSRRNIGTADPRQVLATINSAAQFHFHLRRSNIEQPLRNQVSMELFRLTPRVWVNIGRNLLENGKADIAYESSAMYAVELHNSSDLDLWPYLVYMDPSCYGAKVVYHPDPSYHAPLPKYGHLTIGSGKPGSEAISFPLGDVNANIVYLKLFLCTRYANLRLLEQGPAIDACESISDSEIMKEEGSDSDEVLWDSILSSIAFIENHPTIT